MGLHTFIGQYQIVVYVVKDYLSFDKSYAFILAFNLFLVEK